MKGSGMKRITKKEAQEILDILQEAYPDARVSLDAKNPFELVIATALSAQTTDVQVNKVTPELFRRYPTPNKMAQAPLEELTELIHTIGFFRTKAANIKRASQMLVDEFGGVVPQTMEELTRLPGVGRKTANVVLSVAFHIPSIAVDTHVFRVSNRIGLSKSSDVGACEEDLKKILDRNSWSHAHHLLIFHGRRICKARRPLCEQCSIRQHCRFYASSTGKQL